MMNFSQPALAEDSYFCFESVNGSCPKIIYPTVIRILLQIFFSVILVVTLCGNILVIISITHFKHLHTPTNYLILSLAVTDFLLGSVVMPPYMVRVIESCWYFGDVFCKIHMSADIILYLAAMLNLSFISIDRYYAVCQPLHYRNKITTCATTIMILICWGLSAFVGFGLVFLELNLLGIEDFYYEHVACAGSCVLFQGKTASLICFVLTFFIPGLIMLVIYQKIFHVARKQARCIHSTAGNNAHSEISKMERKATKTLMIVMGVFLSCSTPFILTNLINPFINYSIPPVLIETLFCMTYLNSTCNPIIYAFYYSWFRKAFKMIIFGKIFQAHSSTAKLSTD
ncbi:trace amine-associated receptor 1-like [Anguilla rostrata]|uniref:trace amine-associated receptor 1-like n=1 Tax=Anguilla anguilla TaxID=7936 RepID=UPI0015A82D04|nr:trace amine-associated receptor 1-like [Anguilla anguilla]